MSTTSTQPYAHVRFTHSNAQVQLDHLEVARALAWVHRLAAARSRAWVTRQPTRELTARLETAWQDLRAARAMLTPDKPPADHRSARVAVTVADRRYAGDEDSVARFVRDRCVIDPAARVALSTFAAGLRDYVGDPAEAADLPSTRQLARQLRARGLSVQQAGPVVWVSGVRLLARDETAHMPEPGSD